MRKGILIVQHHGPFCVGHGLLDAVLGVVGEIGQHHDQVAHRKPGLRRGKLLVPCDGLLVERDGGLDVFLGELVHVPLRLLEQVPRSHVSGGLAPCALAFGAGQFRLDGGGDGLGDLVLQGEDVVEVAVVTFRPEV